MVKLSIAQRIGIGLIIIVTLGLLLSRPVIHLLTESWWFNAVDFAEVFWTRMTWQVGVGAIALLSYGALLWGNVAIASRLTRYNTYIVLHELGLHHYVRHVPALVRTLIVVLAVNGGVIFGQTAWETTLKFLNSTPFEYTDPIYSRDIGFYLFDLPFYQQIHGWLLGLLFWCLVLSVTLYSLKGAIEPDRGWQYALRGGSKVHLSLLLAAIALLVAAGFWLQRYSLLYSSSGVVFGAGYTDVNAQEQAYWIMTVATLVLAGLFIGSLWRVSLAIPLYGCGVYLVALIVLTGFYPQFQQRFIVEPNELAKETRYITYNIDFTRRAYGLDDVVRQDYPAENQLDRATLDRNASTIRNIRLWDYRPLLSTYRQLQEIRLYYSFKDVDIDRYTLDGDYRQVMLAARELDYSQVPAEAQTWVNQRLKYTHGYGIAMSPVNVVTSQGLPRLFIKDIPPVSSVDLTVERPGIYYGEDTTNYIFTGTTTEEFDYPRSDGNALTTYSGLGGVPIPSFWQRLAYAYDFNSIKILISNYFAPTSRIHYRRTISDRIHHVAPFLQLDRDPYITVIDGKLKWIMDAYTVSDRFPYSQPLARSVTVSAAASPDVAHGGVNYIRNSVKVVVDAYDGTMEFLVVDETDPVLATYRKIFPGLFSPSADIPPGIKAHFRYPVDLFKAQAQIYSAYHMTDPEVFYNREDLWDVPTEQFDGQPQRMEPYHIIMQLPEGDQEEFILILPFTPVNRSNMIAWMAARSDGDQYGQMVLYSFPKEGLIYGPSQIEARVDQDPVISSQLTLWGQEGSQVIRGNLLVIPIERSLLYVEPIYLQAETGELPELKRVIVAYGDQVVMTETLEASLTEIFGASSTASPDTPADSATSSPDGTGEEAIAPASTSAADPPAPALPENLTDLAEALSTTYEEAQTALQQGDWETYGEKQAELETLIQEFKQQVEN